jgi:membrane-bound metal-dependent hydrolase YbcI (DUF457 family)
MGASAAWLLVPLLPKDDPGFIAIAMVCSVIGALVPDLDAVESKIKHVKLCGIKPFVPIARAINSEFGHRGLLHSLRGWVGWTLLILPLGAVVGWLPVAALSLGYVSHLAGDACTRSGIPLLYPKRRSYHLLPRRFRVVTASEYEELFFAAFALGAIAMLLEHLVI